MSEEVPKVPESPPPPPEPKAAPNANASAGKGEPGRGATPEPAVDVIDRVTRPQSESDNQADHYDTLFAPRKRVHALRGAKCDVPELEVVRERLKRAKCLLLACAVKDHSLWVATSLAEQIGFASVFLGDPYEDGHLAPVTLIQRLKARQESTCVIWDRSLGFDTGSFASHLGDFERSTRDIHMGQHGLIVCLHPAALEAVKAAIPGHVQHFTIEVSQGRDGQKPSSQLDVSAHVEALFSPQARSFQEMEAAGDRTIVPRTLARLAVLFPKISTGHMDTLLRGVLHAKQVEVAPARDGVEAKRADASTLWTAHRATFEGQAGLTRDHSGSSARLRFLSPELESATKEWVWRYPEDLYDLFAAVSREGVLFADCLDEDEQDLFNAYIDAAIELAQREPKLFGGRWLETLLREFAAWVHEQVPQAKSEPPVEDVLTLLARVAEQLAQQERRDHFWERFAHRMGVLCAALFRSGSQVIVTRFFERMSHRGLHELMLQVIARMGEALPAAQRLEWMERVLDQGDEDARLLVARDLAEQLRWYPESAAPYLDQLFLWLAAPDADARDLKREAALGVAVRLFSIASRGTVDPAQESSPLLTVLQSATGKTGSLAEFCRQAVGHADFPAVAAIHLSPDDTSPAERESLALAVSLYQCASALPIAAIEQAKAMARTALAPLRQTDRNLVAGWWNEWASDGRKQMPSSLAPGKASRRRQELLRRCDVLSALMSA